MVRSIDAANGRRLVVSAAESTAVRVAFRQGVRAAIAQRLQAATSFGKARDGLQLLASRAAPVLRFSRVAVWIEEAAERNGKSVRPGEPDFAES